LESIGKMSTKDRENFSLLKWKKAPTAGRKKKKKAKKCFIPFCLEWFENFLFVIVVVVIHSGVKIQAEEEEKKDEYLGRNDKNVLTFEELNTVGGFCGRRRLLKKKKATLSFWKFEFKIVNNLSSSLRDGIEMMMIPFFISVHVHESSLDFFCALSLKDSLIISCWKRTMGG
jgi:hypothetical protein